MSDEIEDELFIKSLEEKLNVTEYSELRRIINKYIIYTKHIEGYYNIERVIYKYLKEKEKN